MDTSNAVAIVILVVGFFITTNAHISRSEGKILEKIQCEISPT